MCYLGDLARLEGDPAAAWAAYRHGLPEARATGDGTPSATALVTCAAIDAAESQYVRAARAGLTAQDLAVVWAAGQPVTLDQGGRGRSQGDVAHD